MTPVDPPHPSPTVDIQWALSDQSKSSSQSFPSEKDFSQWVEAALPQARKNSELTIRIVDQEESQTLNHRYRNKNKSTNVLSFSSDLPPELNIPLLGDLVICAPVIEQEAAEQGKHPQAHWAHMVIHGTLHLLGYDHISEPQAAEMETLETKIITALGFPAPYGED